MKILWAENPLESKVELDERDVAFLKAQIHIHYLGEILCHANFYLNEERLDLERVRKEVAYATWDDEPGGPLEKELERQLKWAIEALTEEAHCGDCTCVPMTCSKCLAEEWMGIDTTKGLRKHPANKMNGAFAEDRSINEAIEYLANYEPTASWEGWEAHADRWKAEANNAHEWLVAYRDEHFPVV